MKVDYKFKLDQKVTTPFNDKGIIDMLGYDHSGVMYYVKTAKASNWFKESQLSEDDTGFEKTIAEM